MANYKGIYSEGPTLLPSEYQEVNALVYCGSTTNSLYIDTFSPQTRTYNLYLQFSHIYASYGTKYLLTGDPGGNNDRVFYIYDNSSSDITLYNHSLGNIITSSCTSSNNITLKYSSDNHTLYKKDFTSGTWDTLSGSGAYPYRQLLRLHIQPWTAIIRFTMKDSDDTTVLYDYVPCYRKSDNVYGLYDIVNNTFNPIVGAFQYYTTDVRNVYHLDQLTVGDTIEMQEMPRTPSEVLSSSYISYNITPDNYTINFTGYKITTESHGFGCATSMGATFDFKRKTGSFGKLWLMNGTCSVYSDDPSDWVNHIIASGQYNTSLQDKVSTKTDSNYILSTSSYKPSGYLSNWEDYEAIISNAGNISFTKSQYDRYVVITIVEVPSAQETYYVKYFDSTYGTVGGYKYCEAKRYDGTNWVPVEFNYYDGTTWHEIKQNGTLDYNVFLESDYSQVFSRVSTNGNVLPQLTSDQIPTKTGYVFSGYSKYGTQYYDSSGYPLTDWNLDQDDGILADWTPEYYTIVLDDAEGYGGQGTVVVQYQTYLPTLQMIPTCQGKQFTGYYYNGTKYYNSDGTPAYYQVWTITDTITMTAQYETLTYTITLDNGQYLEPTYKEVTDGEYINLESYEIPELQGYEFGGYYDNPEGQGEMYIDPYGYGTRPWYYGIDTLYAYWIPSTIVGNAIVGTAILGE